MGYQVGSTCYGSPTAANVAATSAQVGKVVGAGSVAYVVDVTAVGAASATYSLVPLGGGATISQTVALSAHPCGLIEWEDSLALSWAIAAVWIVVYAVLQMRKGVHA